MPARPSVAAIAAILLLACAGCGGGDPEPIQIEGPASLAELTGPWRAEPYVLDPQTWARAEAACVKDVQLAPGPRAVVIDARGGGVLTVRLVGATSGGCDALQIRPDGDIVGAGGGWSGTAPAGGAPPETKLVLEQRGEIGGGDLSVTGWSVLGQAGRGISAVLVDPLAGHPLVRATLVNGWYAAWWPARPGESDPPAGGLGQPHFLPPQVVIRGYDATGGQIEAIQP